MKLIERQCKGYIYRHTCIFLYIYIYISVYIYIYVYQTDVLFFLLKQCLVIGIQISELKRISVHCKSFYLL